jgi:DNA (cytosine-5)-methyltransferase 1
MNKLNYISLFSSAGVGCYGLNQENFKCVATAEILEKRLNIQKYNKICEKEEGYINGDISKENIKKKIYNVINKFKYENKIKDIDVLLATPPCQGISVANHKKKNELKRNSLIVDTFIITKTILPKFFIYENVQSFLKTLCQDKDNSVAKIEAVLLKYLFKSYFIHSKVINLKDFGSNSSRTRSIVIGSRRDLDVNPIDLFPEQTKTKTIKELISKFEKLNKFGEISSDIYHSFRKYDKRMLGWIKNLKEGQSAFDNKKLINKPHMVIDGVIKINSNKNADKYKRNYWNQVAPCIHTRNDILASQNTIHPSENRVFSIRELMTFMTIPNEFKWSHLNDNELNNLPSKDKIKFLKENELNIRHCIGEAVPTNVIRSIAKKISKNSNIKNIGYKNNYSSIYKLIEIHKLNNFANQKLFIDKFYKKLDFEYLLKILELSNPSRDQNSAFFTDNSIAIDIANLLPNFKEKVKILEPSVGVGNILFQVIKKYKNLKKIEIDVFDLDKNILNIFKYLVKKQNYSKNIKVKFYNCDFLKEKINSKYDLVIGNPPFGKLKNTRQLDEYKKLNICKKNKNQFELFFEKALTLSKNIGLILPKSFISSPEYNDLRNQIENKNICTIIDFGEFGFKGVKIETIFLMIDGNLKKNNNINFFSYINRDYQKKSQSYIADKNYPYWLLYRNNFFDNISKTLKFNVFNFFRDRQITKKDTHAHGKIKLIKSRNIDKKGIKKINGYDSYLSNYKKFQVSKFLNKKNLYLVPNLSYYPRACRLPEDSIPDGSAAILIPKNGLRVSNNDLLYFASIEYTEFYRIARNFGTRSLNIDKNSVFFWGLKKAN